MDNKFQYYKDLFPLVHQLLKLLENEVTIGLTDSEQYVCYEAGQRLNFKIKPGDPIKRGALAEKVLFQGKSIKEEIEGSVFGVQYLACGIPLKDDDGVVVGTLLVGMSIEKKRHLKEISRHLISFIQQVSTNAVTISESLEETKASITNMGDFMDVVGSQVKEIAGLSENIRSIAKLSNLLGLNASIEAARAGEYGRGFMVVADEVRKLSQDSEQFSVTIKEQMEKLTEGAEKLTLSVQDSQHAYHVQTDQLDQLSEALEDLQERVYEITQLLKSENT
ncbi:methyl-accepting chemotaxis protein [Pontibacillus sp. ALD_SL1]|uniref:methyl-accepting chemotaxis protein n=1 Tax=Pontibacillus sp. ALD_SL1 TaxID=2777185 RepID=UPI002738DB56|nr:methyl-accepting chemotaxis protein [Pontibacillus sp. ALD_SL1]